VSNLLSRTLRLVSASPECAGHEETRSPRRGDRARVVRPKRLGSARRLVATWLANASHLANGEDNQHKHQHETDCNSADVPDHRSSL